MMCQPSIPGSDMSITISIDLCGMLNNKHPRPDSVLFDDGKLTYFNENNRPKQPKNPCAGDILSSFCEMTGEKKKPSFGKKDSFDNKRDDEREDDDMDRDDDEDDQQRRFRR